MTTIDNLMALHNAASEAAVQYALLAKVSLRSERTLQAADDRDEANEALRAALTEALAQPAPNLRKRELPECNNGAANSTYFRALGWNEAIDAMQAAQPALEPATKSEVAELLAHAWQHHTGAEPSESLLAQAIDNAITALSQPAREPLSEVQIEKIFATCHAGRMYPQDNFSGPRAMRITETRAIERAHGIVGDK